MQWRKPGRSCCLFLVGALAAIGLTGALASNAPLHVVSPGSVVVKLNGPWKFHLGDDLTWAAPGFDDSTWETVDLTPPPGAHDSDVGLIGFVPGWGARGHRGYSGYAWYRLHLSTVGAGGGPLALAGPPAVDSAYQVFVDGRSMGGCGDFSGQTPTAFSVQPRLFIPAQVNKGFTGAPVSIAFRVWMGPWALADPTSGGIRIAPAIGPEGDVAQLFREQWQQTIRGYIVDAVEATIFLILAGFTFVFSKAQRMGNFPSWITIALVVTALLRGNQAVFFWMQIESVHCFELVSVVFLVPLGLGAWTLAWCDGFGLRGKAWISSLVLGLTLILMLSQFFSRSWFHGISSPEAEINLHRIIGWLRWLFLVLTTAVVFLGVRRHPRNLWYLLIGVLLLSIGQFAQELSGLRVRSIWFPFGTGVSRTQFAYAAFEMTFLFLLLRGNCRA